MKVYVHKVFINPQDGWGRSSGRSLEIIGRYLTKEKAIQAKMKRDITPDYFDIGKSWIDEEVITEY